MNVKRVVVTGLGALTPIGGNVRAYWQGLSQGVSGAAPITRFDASKRRVRFACELKGYQPEDYFERKEARKMDPCSQYALVVCEEALKDAGVLEKGNLERIGVVWGTGIGGLQSLSESIINFSRGGETPKMSPFFIPKMIANMPAGNISIKYGLRGPNLTTVSACASASNALIDAAQLIQLDHADVIVAGGSEATITDIGVSGFSAMNALSERNEDPQTASRPFDKGRDGFVMGEGAGALILESYEHAQARGAKIYAEFMGVGMSADAYHITAPHPDGLGAVMVMKNALQHAGIPPEAVDYINVHGTSTPLGDASEAKAIQQVFGAHVYQLSISATKSMTGHLLGASGAVESIASILALQHQIIPPTINHFTDDETFDPGMNFTFNQAQSRPVNVVMSNTFGFGGHNTSIVYKKWEI
ncbi:MAG: beta-ketoacyl-ACP synthase II [Amoebophilaceae bacterium]|jgi:3-oxoacyl-[acyl-carrier-protein] synthase II|nr:beta-ketoacyl-ACP synthase II [Amoebophilaceae bacterium]